MDYLDYDSDFLDGDVGKELERLEDFELDGSQREEGHQEYDENQGYEDHGHSEDDGMGRDDDLGLLPTAPEFGESFQQLESAVDALQSELGANEHLADIQAMLAELAKENDELRNYAEQAIKVGGVGGRAVRGLESVEYCIAPILLLPLFLGLPRWASMGPHARL